jgi:hypothetical protein
MPLYYIPVLHKRCIDHNFYTKQRWQPRQNRSNPSRDASEFQVLYACHSHFPNLSQCNITDHVWNPLQIALGPAANRNASRAHPQPR